MLFIPTKNSTCPAAGKLPKQSRTWLRIHGMQFKHIYMSEGVYENICGCFAENVNGMILMIHFHQAFSIFKASFMSIAF